MKNVRAQITVDHELLRRAHARAAELGVSFSEYVRRLVIDDVEKQRPDISIVFDLDRSGRSTDVARDKDKMIGEAVWQEYLRKTGRKPRRRSQPKPIRF
jgi:hypothetical protein